MDQAIDWGKLAILWAVAIVAHMFEHFTLGSFAIVATILLTLLQCAKVWLDIMWRVRRDRRVR